MTALPAFLAAFWPRPMSVSWPERLRGAIGGGFGIAFAAFVSLATAKALHLSPWLVAPIGASAVLVFAVPASPLAQPWSVIGGNTVTAIAGLLACNLIPDPLIAASVAVGLAIAAMFALRCLHPPGGAMALLVVLTHTRALEFALFPAFTNSLLLVLAGLVYHAATRHSYPHVPKPAPVDGLIESDFQAAIAHETEWLDIDPADLRRLIAAAERHAEERRKG
jgi:CBS domain-containing membrane protein